MQKPHPSQYGKWSKISFGEPRRDIQSHQAKPNNFTIEQSSPDDELDLKKLDEILSQKITHPEHTEENVPEEHPTYDTDPSLEALDSIISDIKKKTVEQSSVKKTDSQQPSSYQDVMTILKQDKQIHLRDLDDSILSDTQNSPSPYADIEELEDEYLKVLEQRYTKEKK